MSTRLLDVVVRQLLLVIACVAPSLPAAEDPAWPWRFPRMVSSNMLHAEGGDVQVVDSALDAQGRLYLAGSIIRIPQVSQIGLASLVPQASLALGGGSQDIFIARISPSGDAIEYLVHLGGSNNDQISSIAVDSLGRAIVSGWTESADFPKAANHQQLGANGARDAFVLVLDAQGASLAATARIGGAEMDQATAIAVAPDGGIVVAGITESPELPTTEGAFQRAHRGKTDGFAMKFNANLAGLQWSTLVGGPTADEIRSIALTSGGGVIAAGVTGDGDRTDPELPVSLASFGPKYNGLRDAFVLKLNASGSGVEWAGYLGGDELDTAKRVRIARDGNVVVMGETYSVPALTRFMYQPNPAFPLVPAFTPADPPLAFHRLATFLTAISADGAEVVFSRVPREIGGFASDFAIAPDGSLAVLGYPSSQSRSPFSGPATDLVSNPFSLDWGGWSYAFIFNADASLVRFYTRGFPVFRTGYVSTAFHPDGRFSLIALTREADVPLGPVTGTVALLDRPFSHTSTYVMTLRSDGGPRCAATLQVLPAQLNPAGGVLSIQVNAEPGCPWNFLRDMSATPNAGTTFELGFPAAGVGDGQIVASYPANESRASRLGTLAGSMTTVSAKQLSVLCQETTIRPGALGFPSTGGTLEVTVDVIPDCGIQAEAVVPWPFSPWFSLVNHGDSSTLRLSVTAAPNPGPARVGSIRAGNSTITVMQASGAGCLAAFPNGPLEIGPTGGTVFVPFTLDGASCRWTVASSASWATLSSSSIGVGAGSTAQIQVEPFNSQSFRESKVVVNGVSFPIRQAGFSLDVAPEITGVVDAAAYRAESLSSGGLATLFGKQLTGSVAHAIARPLPVSLEGVVLRIRASGGEESPAQLVYISPSQINFLLADGVVGDVEFRVEHGQRVSQWFTATVLPFQPSLFQISDSMGNPLTFAGYAHLVLPDGTVRLTPLTDCDQWAKCTLRPVDRGPAGSELHVVLFGTGFPADATVEEYQGPAWQSRFTVSYAGRHQDFVGLQQINVRIPRDVFISGVAMFDVAVRGQRTLQLPVQFMPLVD